MRRALIVAAAAVPLAVLAAITTAPSGKVVDLDNYNTVAATSYINAAQCAGTAQLNLQWNSIDVNGGLTSNGTYRIFASNTAPPTSGDATVANFCPEEDDTNVSPNVFAGSVDSIAWSSDIQGKQVSGLKAATEAHVECTASGEGDIVYVCAHLYDQNSARKGYASGKFLVQVAAPDAPTGVRVGAGNTRLYVSWTASGGTVDVDHYVAEATPVGGGTTFFSDSTDLVDDVPIEGLTNGTAYDVVVRAYSVGGNPSPPSAATPESVGTPVPVDDFWRHYRSMEGAVENGGCGAGGAGPLALLGLALIALARRRA